MFLCQSVGGRGFWLTLCSIIKEKILQMINVIWGTQTCWLWHKMILSESNQWILYQWLVSFSSLRELSLNDKWWFCCDWWLMNVRRGRDDKIQLCLHCVNKICSKPHYLSPHFSFYNHCYASSFQCTCIFITLFVLSIFVTSTTYMSDIVLAEKRYYYLSKF